MNNSSISPNTLPSQIPANAFLVPANKGAGKALKTVKNEFKQFGCRWHPGAGAWSCPASAQKSVEAMLNGKQIGIASMPFYDDYFLKCKNGQEAERLWI